MKKKYLSILALSMALTTSCNFLDVMPDKLGTIEYAFRDQVSAENQLLNSRRDRNQSMDNH